MMDETNAELTGADLRVSASRLRAARRRDRRRNALLRGDGAALCAEIAALHREDCRAIWSAIRDLCRRRAHPAGLLALKRRQPATVETQLALQISRMELARLVDQRCRSAEQHTSAVILGKAVFGSLPSQPAPRGA
ncbi:MAG: hypothetical protein RIC36_14875 [Rhodospirillales bacterium]